MLFSFFKKERKKHRLWGLVRKAWKKFLPNQICENKKHLFYRKSNFQAKRPTWETTFNRHPSPGSSAELITATGVLYGEVKPESS